MTHRGIKFGVVRFAHQIWDLTSFDDIKIHAKVPVKKYANYRSAVRPEKGDLLIYSKKLLGTGHVAAIVQVEANRVLIAEQNYLNVKWPDPTFSRQLLMTQDKNGFYAIHDEKILGWLRADGHEVQTIESKTMENQINKSNYKEALKSAVADPKVNIKIAPLTGDDSFSLFVTEIPAKGKVGAHYHKEGLETYQILSGKGMMYIGNPISDNSVEWLDPVEVKEGDFFTIPKGIVHQLRNPFDEKLVLVFGCPKSHLSTDRTIVQEKL